MKNKPINLFVLNIIAIVVAYYVSILLHEWAHGTIAWLYGAKSSPFNVEYGGWFLMNADENVDYPSLLAVGRGIAAAFIGIAGTAISLLFAIFSFYFLNKKSIQKNLIKLIFTYWFLIINMIPLLQYFTITTFSTEGDVGRFTHGLNISGLWIFIPGTLFIIWSLWRILHMEIPKMYAYMPIKYLLNQSVFLLLTLCLMFLFIYTHGYNPFSDKGISTFSRYMAIFSIFLVPILFFICYPARKWVKVRIAEFKNFLLKNN